MKQLCYLAAEQDLHRLDSLFNELDITPSLYSVELVKSLTAFISREKTLYQQNYIIIDLMKAEYSQEHILSAVQLLRRFSVAELIFISPDNDNTTQLYGKLAAFRVNRLISVHSDTNYIAEVRRMLTAKNEDFAFSSRMEAVQRGLTAAAKKIACPVTIPEGLVMNIAVAGTMGRIGTTTQTFTLWYYMSSLGFKPAIQLADKKMQSMLMELYRQESEDNKDHVLIRGIPFCSELCVGFNAYITDLDVLTASNLVQFAEADLSVLVTGVKPWELTELGTANSRLKDCKPKRLVTLASFAGDQDLNAFRTFLGESYAATPYHPDIWSECTSAAYQAAILPHVKDYCEDEL